MSLGADRGTGFLDFFFASFFSAARVSPAITNCRRRGIDERTIMRQSGHKTRSAFDRYNIVDDNDQRAAVRQYEAALPGHVLDTPPSNADSGKTKAPDFSRAFG